MSDIEVLGWGIGVLIYAVVFIFGIFVALAPLFCWIHLRRIRRRQEEAAQRVDSHLCAMRRSLEKIDDTLRYICGILNKK